MIAPFDSKGTFMISLFLSHIRLSHTTRIRLPHTHKHTHTHTQLHKLLESLGLWASEILWGFVPTSIRTAFTNKMSVHPQYFSSSHFAYPPTWTGAGPTKTAVMDDLGTQGPSNICNPGRSWRAQPFPDKLPVESQVTQVFPVVVNYSLAKTNSKCISMAKLVWQETPCHQ